MASRLSACKAAGSDRRGRDRPGGGHSEFRREMGLSPFLQTRFRFYGTDASATINRCMSIGRQFVIWNACAVVGIVISIFLVPGNTPFWLWACIAGAFLCILNAAKSLQRKRPTDEAAAASRTRTTIIVLALAFLVVDLLLSRYFGR